MAGCFEGGNVTSGAVKRGELVEYLRTCWFLWKDSAPWNSLIYVFFLTLELECRDATLLCVRH